MAVAGYTKNNKNFIRAYRLLIDIGSPVLRDYLKKLVHIQGFGTIDDFLKHHSKRFRKRLRDKKLQKYQYDSLYPTGGQTVDPETWDISLLCLLLRENFTLSPIERQAVDTLRRVRNTVFGHTPVTCLDDVKFEDVWTDLERAIVSILHHTGDKQAEKETLEKIRHVRDKRIDADESVLDDIRHKLERLISLTESYERETDAEDDKTKLQKFLVKAYSEYTDFGSHLVCPLRAGYRLLVDNIYVDEQFRDITPRGMVSVNYLNQDPNDQVIQNSLQASFKNLFEPCDTNVSPRHVVLVGEAGRGKTTYCLKLLSRWCSAMRKLLEGQQEFTETEEELMQFELLYFISLRHAIEEESVVDMIESQILTENGQLMATVKKYFQSMPEKSLV